VLKANRRDVAGRLQIWGLILRYDAFKTWVSEAIERAPPERRLVFARETVAEVLNSSTFDEIDLAIELSDKASAALAAARREIFTASPATLRSHLEVIDAGVLTEGIMDPRLLFMVQAIDDWASYLDEKDLRSLVCLAVTAIEQIDWQISPSLEDFLAGPEMQAERDRIAHLLGT
jgi:hypothetical protein